jgi:hypothetical protein
VSLDGLAEQGLNLKTNMQSCNLNSTVLDKKNGQMLLRVGSKKVHFIHIGLTVK